MKSSDTHPARAVFFQVFDTSTKFRCITETARSHFLKKESLLFFVEDEKSENFLNELLWKFPETSFLPHAIANEIVQEWTPVAITRSKMNVNNSAFAFNLCPTPLLLPGFKIIYEFEDLSAPNKKNLSSLRFNAYKNAGFFLESRYAETNIIHKKSM